MSGGGGGPVVGGTVQWGPDYGEPGGSDGVTFSSRTAIDLDSIALAGTITAKARHSGDALAANYDAITARTAHAGDSVHANYNAMTARTAHAGDALAANYNAVTARTSHAGDHLAADYNAITNRATLTGTVLGPPFWQSSATQITQDALSNDCTISKPSGTVEGDLLLAFIGHSNATITPPSGWTEINQAIGNSQASLGSFYKVATASEPSSYTFVGNGAVIDTILGIINRINAVDTASPINVAAQTATNTQNLTYPSVTTTSINTLVFGAYCHAHTTGLETHGDPTPAGQTTRMDEDNIGLAAAARGMQVCSRVYAATGATGTLGSTCSRLGNSGAVAHRVAITPTSLVIA